MTDEQYERPVIVCLCGSTRFYEAFQRANYEETMAGRIVLSVGHYPHSTGQAHGEAVGCTPEQKMALDELHKRKIDLADEILVLNCLWPYCERCEKYLDADANYCDACEERTRGSGKAARLGYVGDSTRSEIEYARKSGKVIRWLEPASTTTTSG